MDLKKILETLNSDKNRIEFLNQIYIPGNIEVADILLENDKNISLTIEKEIDYAKEHGLEKRFKELAKKLIDHYLDDGYPILVEKPLIKWNDEDLAEYALARMIKLTPEECLSETQKEMRTE